MANEPYIDGASWCYAFPGTPTNLDSQYPIPMKALLPDGSFAILTDNTLNSATWAYYHFRGIAKAWVTFAGSNGAIQSGFNVTSVTRNSTGNYTINFSTPMQDTNYSVQAMGRGTRVIISIDAALSQSNCRIQAEQANALSVVSTDPTIVCVSVFGNFSP